MSRHLPSETTKIIVFGAGGHAKVVIEALELSHTPPMAVCDDDVNRKGENYAGYSILGPRAALGSFPAREIRLVVALARNDVRYRLVKELSEQGLCFCGVCHPSAIVSHHANVNSTAQLMAGVVVNPGATLARHVVLNTGSVVDHDSMIAEFVHVGPGATLTGAVQVGKGSFIGAGATILPFVKIGRWSTVGAGAVVVRNVLDGQTVAGVPARVIRS